MDAYCYALSTIKKLIFATRCCILLIFNHNYFRRSQVKTDKNRQKNHKKIRVVARLHGFFCTFAAGN